ncbi:MAG TPA: O-methyltransferase [Vicinamibacterales bacterium]|jgi:caffeoyl-CoA O-methyltransferase|nr:O-methyltransferase [Vicinamibacterales bacterium]
MSDPLFSEPLRTYLDDLVPARHPELARMEAYAREHDFPIIGPASGQCCYVLSRLAGARRVFELGSGYGYSTAWFARAVMENGGGEVHHVVWDKDLSDRARKHLAAIGVDGVVRFHVSEAVETLRATPGQWDVIFMDIDKRGYPDAVPLIAERLRKGGILIVDNMLWSGRVFDAADRSADTEAIRRATERLTRSPEWISTLVPIRDGLLVSYRT